MGSGERDVYITKGIGVETSGPKNVAPVGQIRNTDTVAVGLWVGLTSGGAVTEVIYRVSGFEPRFQVIKVFVARRIQRDQISKIVNTISRKECFDDVPESRAIEKSKTVDGITRPDNMCRL